VPGMKFVYGFELTIGYLKPKNVFFDEFRQTRCADFWRNRLNPCENVSTMWAIASEFAESEMQFGE
jgi:hypothetical protein